MTFSLTTFLAAVLTSVLLSYFLIAIAFFYAVNSNETVLRIVRRLNNKSIKSRKILTKEISDQNKIEISYLNWAWVALQVLSGSNEKSSKPKDAKK